MTFRTLDEADVKGKRVPLHRITALPTARGPAAVDSDDLQRVRFTNRDFGYDRFCSSLGLQTVSLSSRSDNLT